MIPVFLCAVSLVVGMSIQESPLGWVDLGQDIQGKGLTVPNMGDGQHEAAVRGGAPCRVNRPGSSPASAYLYFDVAEGLIPQKPCSVYVTAEYYPESWAGLTIEYDGQKDPYTKGQTEMVIPTGPSGQWETVTFHLKDIAFQSRQNGGSDFRFFTGGAVPLRRVVLSLTPPPGWDSRASARERIERIMGQVERPQGMEYTFGNDVNESTAPLYRALGVTSIESYVTWQTVEDKGQGQWDWSQWDEQVRILKENDLKWVPFLIVGPAYSNPKWFREDPSKHVGCVCLEHQIPSKIESIWNPSLRPAIVRFLQAFKERYLASGVIESVLLGISGDFGEAIYSVSGGGWTFIVPGEYHNHGGFWCGDEYAVQDFRDKMLQKYGSLRQLNKTWGTDWSDLSQIDFPARGEEKIQAAFEQAQDWEPASRRRWLDFVQWYRNSMTDWSEWWMARTREIFPDTEIYLCTGGDAHPQHGSQFADQCKVSARHQAGVRITNEASDYAANFSITRWVGGACRFYGTYFGYEPAGAEDEKGIRARIYNATASGAHQLHDYNPNVTTSQSRIEAQRAHYPYLFKATPRVSVALWYPDVAMTLRWGGYLSKAAELRDVVDFDYVDETMLRDGALSRYKVLAMIHGAVVEKGDFKILKEWVKQGGVIVSLNLGELQTVEGDRQPGQRLFDQEGQEGQAGGRKKIGKGYTVWIPVDWGRKKEFFRGLVQVVQEQSVVLPGWESDGVYGTVLEPGELFFLNTRDEAVSQKVFVPGQGVREVTVPAATIYRCPL